MSKDVLHSDIFMKLLFEIEVFSSTGSFWLILWSYQSHIHFITQHNNRMQTIQREEKDLQALDSTLPYIADDPGQ